ncbi:hypothetical protein PROFUN_15685 [Planoprotostelium fungivorum]|uniref:MIP18 family-like domain-containing protein n=1 Tax=Planoprotostelium fungivorum TaxID=1890364 RepID=A0A2P6MV56_9EUKA|nr:hypothetical protein PROFUN_15685 [Planoprotostelium fungivorum]
MTRAHTQVNMTGSNLDNPNPVVFELAQLPKRTYDPSNLAEEMESQRDDIDPLEVFDMIRKINDPEHPLTLEQLKVTQYENIKVDDENSYVNVRFTPTIPHCSMATLIGLCIRVKLLRSLPSRFKVDIQITPGTHSQEEAVNKQLNDKERVAAALENNNLLSLVNNCISNSD